MIDDYPQNLAESRVDDSTAKRSASEPAGKIGSELPHFASDIVRIQEDDTDTTWYLGDSSHDFQAAVIKTLLTPFLQWSH